MTVATNSRAPQCASTTKVRKATRRRAPCSLRDLPAGRIEAGDKSPLRLGRVGQVAAQELAAAGLALLLDTLRGRATPDRLSQTQTDVPIYATLDLGAWGRNP